MLFLVLLLTTKIVQGQEGLIGYDCSRNNHTTIKKISLLDIHECDIKKPNISTTEVYIQLLETIKHRDISVVQCKIILK